LRTEESDDMPMSPDFRRRLLPLITHTAAHYGTPFHLYDEAGIRATCRQLKQAFAGIPGFMEYYAVKALPNPAILRIMHEEGFGFDCSSVAELLLARQAGGSGERIMFTSNNTTQEEFAEALAHGGCVLNLDDVSLIDKVPTMPELVSFRYNPGPRRSGNVIIGNPLEAKYGITHDQVLEAYRGAMARGAKRFGLHTMIASNARMILALAQEIGDGLGIRFAFVNIGGGLGIPYRPEQQPLNLTRMATEITALFDSFRQHNGYAPRMVMESGRFMTGPHGVLATHAINSKHIYRQYVGVDACMSALMRPGMYDAYHHVTVVGKEDVADRQIVDVVGSLCENNDKFAVQRELPPIVDGDLLLIHDTGAHGHAMGFNYNGRLRPKELLLREDGSVALIRREETLEDHFATLHFTPDVLPPA
jgi:diaminopimelate decarboxylase